MQIRNHLQFVAWWRDSARQTIGGFVGATEVVKFEPVCAIKLANGNSEK